ncbi:MAG TPA: hypothetical protein PLB67_04415 [Candidatus Hydrogenedentes bacterium]|jgi:flagellar basal body-associated protein FliL|nr:hypothetical protein [Candidatus Hydrogenedentota bacterium]MDY0032033.1 hypothetical protein [FCB group bacterium]NLT62469.1 hypothetical protein [Candidatus Hydrogenedentota bacterium]HNV21276.1 hypothetical protein [Candidatus Hydrogenedentota bacterium]HNZ18015.1 hypothetical protein [Candidatus Hydrogenedentota bacterium]
MADEPQPAVPVPRKSSLVGLLIWLGVACMVAVLGALLLYFVMFRPRLAEDAAPVDAGSGDKLNPNTVTVDFDESVASVKMPQDSQLPASLLSFQVSLECNDQITAALVQKHIARFTDMINKQHEFRTRAELDDPRVKTDIQKTILLEANTILKQLQPGPPDPNIRVTAVFHKRFLVSD